MRTEPIHRINLKGPWVYEWLDGPHGSANSDASKNSPLLADSRVRMPTSLQTVFGNVSGRILFRRRFQRPTNLDENEQVHIAFDGIGGRADIAVNGQSLGNVADNAETVSFDMTQLLGPSNELTVELTISSGDDLSPAGLYKPVAIEIHPANG
jgi:beta-galactosidase/beta-glucuronidase